MARNVKIYDGERETGFTLVELLIALFVFSLLSAFSYRSVSLLTLSMADTHSESGALLDVQKAWSLWQKDLQASLLDSKTLQPKDDEVLNNPTNGELLADFGKVKYVLRKGRMYRQSLEGVYKTEVKLMQVDSATMTVDSSLLREGVLISVFVMDHPVLGKTSRVFWALSSDGALFENSEFQFAEVASAENEGSQTAGPSEASLIDEAVF